VRVHGRNVTVEDRTFPFPGEDEVQDDVVVVGRPNQNFDFLKKSQRT
jgi:hypothetical protein